MRYREQCYKNTQSYLDKGRTLCWVRSISISTYRVSEKCLDGTAKITLASCRLQQLWESFQSGGATHKSRPGIFSDTLYICWREHSFLSNDTDFSSILGSSLNFSHFPMIFPKKLSLRNWLYSAEPKLWSTEVYENDHSYETKSQKPKPHSIDLMLIFNWSYELIEVMNYRSYEVNSLTKSTNLRQISNRSYEVNNIINFSQDQMFGPFNPNWNWNYRSAQWVILLAQKEIPLLWFHSLNRFDAQKGFPQYQKVFTFRATLRIVSASVLLCLTNGEPLHTNAFSKIVLTLRVHIAYR